MELISVAFSVTCTGEIACVSGEKNLNIIFCSFTSVSATFPLFLILFMCEDSSCGGGGGGGGGRVENSPPSNLRYLLPRNKIHQIKKQVIFWPSKLTLFKQFTSRSEDALFWTSKVWRNWAFECMQCPHSLFTPFPLLLPPLLYFLFVWRRETWGWHKGRNLSLSSRRKKIPLFVGKETSAQTDKWWRKEKEGDSAKKCVEKISSKRLTPFSRPIRCDAKKMFSPPFFRGKNDRVLLWRCFQEGKALVRVLLLFLLHGSFFISILSITISQGWPK